MREIPNSNPQPSPSIQWASQREAKRKAEAREVKQLAEFQAIDHGHLATTAQAAARGQELSLARKAIADSKLVRHLVLMDLRM